MTRVLHVLDKICVNSGASTVVMNYYNSLNHDDFTFDFMLNEDVDAETREYIEGRGSKIFLMPDLRAANLFKYIGALRRFYKEYSQDYKIVHGHVANSAVFYLGLARKTVSYRIIHSHNTMSSDVFWKRIRNWVLTRFIRRVANRFAACSEKAAVFLFGTTDGVTIFNNAVDIDKFLYNADVRESLRRDLSLGDKLVVGHVGRFSAQKNHRFLIDVFSELHKVRSDAMLMLIGSGELYDDVVRSVSDKGLTDAVMFVGSVDNVNDYMNAMDVFVLPSLFEGLPLTGVEAQINGLPCVFSDEVTREVGISGASLFLPIDGTRVWVDELVNAVKRGRVDVADIRMGEFDINVQVNKLEGYYGELLSEC